MNQSVSSPPLVLPTLKHTSTVRRGIVIPNDQRRVVQNNHLFQVCLFVLSLCLSNSQRPIQYYQFVVIAMHLRGYKFCGMSASSTSLQAFALWRRQSYSRHDPLWNLALEERVHFALDRCHLFFFFFGKLIPSPTELHLSLDPHQISHNPIPWIVQADSQQRLDSYFLSEPFGRLFLKMPTGVCWSWWQQTEHGRSILSTLSLSSRLVFFKCVEAKHDG